MNKQRAQDEYERREPRPHAGHAGDDHPAGEPGRPGGHGGDLRHDRLDTIEWADDRTRALDPHHGGIDEDPIEDLLDGDETDASYRAEATRVTPTLDPESEDDSER